MPNQNTQDPRTCSFCGQPCTGDKMFIAGIEPDTYICNDCVDACVEYLQVLTEKKQKKKDDKLRLTMKTPAEIKAALDEYVIGQDRAKVALFKGHGDTGNFTKLSGHQQKGSWKSQHV